MSYASQGHLDGLSVASCLTPDKVTLMVCVLHPDASHGHLDGLGVASCLMPARVTLMVWVLHPV